MKALIANTHNRMGYGEGYFEVQVTGRTACSAAETLVEIKWVDEDQVHTKWLSEDLVRIIKEPAE